MFPNITKVDERELSMQSEQQSQIVSRGDAFTRTWKLAS